MCSVNCGVVLCSVVGVGESGSSGRGGSKCSVIVGREPMVENKNPKAFFSIRLITEEQP